MAPSAADVRAPSGAPVFPGGGGMARGLTSDVAPSLRLPGEHFAASTGFLVLASAGLVWVAPELAAGLYPSPHVVAVTHLFTLGWLTTTIFGALYQLLPVALGAPVYSERLGHASFCAFVPGVATFVLGVALVRPTVVHAGLGLVTLGILAATVNLMLTLPRAITRDVTWAAVVTALSFLVLTLVLGATLAVNLTSGVLGGLRTSATALHLHVALVGWVLVTIVGISHRLLPMFLLAHGADERWSRRALALLVAGLVLLIGGLGAGRRAATWLGVLALDGGVACFLAQAWCFAKVRKRRRLDAGLRHAAAALAFLAAGALLGPAVLAFGRVHPRVAVAYVLLGAIGGLALYVVGQFYKIVPFLAWITKYRGVIGRRPVPAVADLYSARVARLDLAGFVAAVLGLAGGTLAGHAAVVRAAAALFLAATLLFASQLVRIVWSTPR